MSSDEDDYLSAKYLVETQETTAPKTYSQVRKEREKKAHERHEQNRPRGRRERELEARQAGLSKSLFERAKEDQEAGIASGSNKALSMMMKMGFKPGQSLGRLADDNPQSGGGQSAQASTASLAGAETVPSTSSVSSLSGNSTSISDSTRTPSHASTHDLGDSEEGPQQPHTTHMKVPLPLDEWAGEFLSRSP